jgi:LPXTG-site transpeptidase (sortase) family protein
VAIAGHRTTYLAPFRTIDTLEPGDEVIASMPYGRFVYRVEKTEIVSRRSFGSSGGCATTASSSRPAIRSTAPPSE